MARWRGDWVFMNVMHYKHRSSGSETVTAESEESARMMIKSKATRSLFGGNVMTTYITVSNLTKVKESW